MAAQPTKTDLFKNLIKLSLDMFDFRTGDFITVVFPRDNGKQNLYDCFFISCDEKFLNVIDSNGVVSVIPISSVQRIVNHHGEGLLAKNFAEEFQTKFANKDRKILKENITKLIIELEGVPEND